MLNRVAEILDRSTVDQWRHIAGADHTADLGTRGLSINELMQSGWINGRDWLKSEVNKIENLDQEEVVLDREVSASNSNEKSPPIDWKRFSKFRRLRNVPEFVSERKPKKKQKVDLDMQTSVSEKNILLFYHILFQQLNYISSFSKSTIITNVLNRKSIRGVSPERKLHKGNGVVEERRLCQKQQ